MEAGQPSPHTSSDPAAPYAQAYRGGPIFVAPPPPPPRRGVIGTLWRLIAGFLVVLPGLFVVLLAVGMLASLGGDEQVAEHYHSLSKTAADKIAVISVEGAILNGDGFTKKQIDQVRDDAHVKAVVLRINSPGGTVTASDYLLHHLQRLTQERKIPLVVSMGGIAASGGYYLAMAVGDTPDAIFAEPTTWTGSIGVIIPHYNVAGLMKTWEIEDDSVKSGPLKQLGTPTRPMTPEERAVMQELVDDSFNRFKDMIRSGRPALAKDEEALARVTTGQVFSMRSALQNGLVDKEGYIESAIDRAIELAGLERDRVQVVKYKRHAGLFDLPFSAEARQPFDLSTLVDLTAPRAYYLCTWLPPIATHSAQ